ncbi:fimbrial protein [Kluyvera intermedia]|uniref:fimbrial protein n=1 Tax=Kluyvera intermedia TaxID=61648 RepID=UPI0035247B84
MFSKFNYAIFATLVIMVYVASAHAADTDKGHGAVTFSGSIVDAPCSIKSGEDGDAQTVKLGQVSAAALKNQGMSTSVPFKITLENCTLDAEGDQVQVTFTGTPDGNDDTMLGLNGQASGAGIVISDQSGNALDLGDASELTNLQDGHNDLMFHAYLKGDKGVLTKVVPGEFHSVANFSLAYQ